MQVTHHLDGCKCWVCPYDTASTPAMAAVNTVTSINVGFNEKIWGTKQY
jgi:hypothetical protein